MTEIYTGEILGGGGGDGGDNLIIPTGNIPPAAWQAIYYHLSKKVEVTRKLFSGAFTIRKENIIDLIDRLEQVITAYNPQASKVEISFQFRKDTSENLTGKEKFIAFDVSHKASATKSIAIDFDFIMCPANELSNSGPPLKFKVFGMIDQDFFSDPDPEQAGFFEDGVAGKNIVFVVEYSEYMISRALVTAIDDWVETLNKREVAGILKRIPKFIRFMRGSIPPLACGFMIIPFVRSDVVLTEENQLSSLLLLMASLFLIFGITKIFIGWIMTTIAKIQPTTYLLFTSGDTNRMDSIKRKSSRRVAIFVGICTLGVLAFVIGTFSSLFATYLMSIYS